MTAHPVKVITFDIWDTIVIDDSDEPKRKAMGLHPKPVARRELLHEFLSRQEPIERRLVDLAYDVTDAAFNKVWHDQFVTWTIGQRLKITMNGLRRTMPEDDFAELVRLHEEMELDVRPEPVPGVAEAIQALAKQYTLAIVSDAIVSPGRCLRELLKGVGILDCFKAFAFSDEVGCSKPAKPMFDCITQALGCSIEEIVHIGDREHNDVNGPHAIGARAILLTVAKDRGSDTSKADAICRDYKDLPALVDALNV